MAEFKRIVYSIIMFFIFISLVNGQTIDKQKIIIYYFADESSLQNYRYYSYIIPDNLAIELQNNVEYEVTVLPVTFNYISDDMPQEEKENTITILSTRAKEVNAKFVIIGSYKVEKKRIFIQTQIYNTVTGELTDAAEVEETIGAIVYEIIEKITSKINSQLQKTLDVEKEKIALSPYKDFYSAFQNIYFGYSYSYVFFTGSWENLYNDPKMSSVYIGFPLSKMYASNSALIKNIYIVPTWQFYSTNNHDLKHINDSYLSIYTGSIALQYQYSLSPFMIVFASLGAGVSYSDMRLVLASEGGPFSPETKTESTDPYLGANLGAIFYIYNIGISGGLGYNRILYKGDDLASFVMSFGILYRL